MRSKRTGRHKPWCKHIKWSLDFKDYIVVMKNADTFSYQAGQDVVITWSKSTNAVQSDWRYCPKCGKKKPK